MLVTGTVLPLCCALVERLHASMSRPVAPDGNLFCFDRYRDPPGPARRLSCPSDTMDQQVVMISLGYSTGVLSLVVAPANELSVK